MRRNSTRRRRSDPWYPASPCRSASNQDTRGDPAEPLPPAKEFVLVQNEYYFAAAANGVQASDYNKMFATTPDIVCFNGRPGQYQDAPIRVTRGDRVRLYIVCAGPSHPCNFHIVGEQFDTVYLAAVACISDPRRADVRRSAGW